MQDCPLERSAESWFPVLQVDLFPPRQWALSSPCVGGERSGVEEVLVGSYGGMWTEMLMASTSV